MGDLLRDKLNEKGMLLLDSAMGTMLQSVGLTSDDKCDALWNVDPEGRSKILQVHRANVDAGSNIIIANTFVSNPRKLAHFGLEDRTEELNQAAVEIAVEAADGRAIVCGDLGPSGEILEEWGGQASRQELVDAYSRQVEGMVAGGAKMVALETYMDVEELLCTLEAVRTVAGDIPVLASMTFGDTPGGIRTMWGLSPADVAGKLESAGVQAVGANCGMGSDIMLVVSQEMAGATSLPVAAQPNAGAPRMQDGVTVFDETPGQMAEYAVKFRDAGVKLLGGCCGSTPEYIAAAGKNLGL
jgi:5-methyltetrahydrofolate--homocysteine methyltransferase